MIKLRLAVLLSIVLGLLSLSLPVDRAQASTQSTHQALDDSAASIDAYWQSIFDSYDFEYYAPNLAFEQGEFDAPCRGEAAENSSQIAMTNPRRGWLRHGKSSMLWKRQTGGL